MFRELVNFGPQLAVEEFVYQTGLAIRPSPLLVIGHMRSGSSLLCHLLNTHPKVRAFGEANMGYTRLLNFRRLHSRCGKFVPGKQGVKFDVDKILHNCHGIDPTLAAKLKTKYLFLVREPRRSLMSIKKMSAEWMPLSTDNERWKYAALYYCQRLNWMREFCLKLASQSFLVVDYEGLIGQTKIWLDRFASFLDLEPHFSEKYETTKASGQFGYGDTSKNISAGKVVQTAADPELVVPSQFLRQAEESWSQFAALREESDNRDQIGSVPAPKLRLKPSNLRMPT